MPRSRLTVSPPFLPPMRPPRRPASRTVMPPGSQLASRREPARPPIDLRVDILAVARRIVRPVLRAGIRLLPGRFALRLADLVIFAIAPASPNGLPGLPARRPPATPAAGPS